MVHQKKTHHSAQVSKSLNKNDRVEKDKLINSLMSNSTSKGIDVSMTKDED